MPLFVSRRIVLSGLVLKWFLVQNCDYCSIVAHALLTRNYAIISVGFKKRLKPRCNKKNFQIVIKQFEF